MGQMKCYKMRLYSPWTGVDAVRCRPALHFGHMAPVMVMMVLMLATAVGSLADGPLVALARLRGPVSSALRQVAALAEHPFGSQTHRCTCTHTRTLVLTHPHSLPRDQPTEGEVDRGEWEEPGRAGASG